MYTDTCTNKHKLINYLVVGVMFNFAHNILYFKLNKLMTSH